MKAIVILFEGEFKSKGHKKDAIGTIAGVINETTGCSSIEVHDFDGASIAKALFTKTNEETTSETNISNLINSFCYSIITKIGDPAKFDNQNQFKAEFLKRFLSDAEIRKNNTEAIKYLINTGKLQPVHKKILESNHLLFIPDYLKDVNNIINICY